MRLVSNNLQQHRLEVGFDFAGELINRLKRDIVNCQKRTGVTLTEVLMSLMIMSIGVSAVAVLFPVSTLRAIQANQLTHGAIVKYNVEALLQSDPKWVVDPDRDGNLLEHFKTPLSRNYIVDPLAYYTHFADGNVNNAAIFYGNDGVNGGGPLARFGGGLKTLTGANETVPAARDALRLAALTIATQGDGWTTDIDATPLSVISTANGIVGVQLAGPADLDLTQVATSNLLLPGTAPSSYLIPDPELYRVVVYSGDGKLTQAYPLNHISPTNAVIWSEDTDANGTGDRDFNMSGTMSAVEDIRPLPVEFGGAVSRVLLQSRRTNDFSWLLSVRRRSDGAVQNVDIVVRYTNGVDLADERLFEATFVKGTNVVGIRYPYRANATDTTTPKFKRGKFILDAQNARWYRVQDYKERPLGNLGWGYPEYDAIVHTETEITAAGGEDQFSKFDSSGAVNLLLNGALDSGQYDNAGRVQDPRKADSSIPPVYTPIPESDAFPGNGDSVLNYGFAMFPSGVIDVYPTGSMKMPSSL
jgi:prepilin-type N-terminal cleavage/methylation domain-containing protein